MCRRTGRPVTARNRKHTARGYRIPDRDIEYGRSRIAGSCRLRRPHPLREPSIDETRAAKSGRSERARNPVPGSGIPQGTADLQITVSASEVVTEADTGGAGGGAWHRDVAVVDSKDGPLGYPKAHAGAQLVAGRPVSGTRVDGADAAAHVGAVRRAANGPEVNQASNSTLLTGSAFVAPMPIRSLSSFANRLTTPARTS